MLNVEHYQGHDGKTRAGIGSIVGLAQGMQAPAPEGEPYYYGIDDHGREFPETMPDFIKEKVLASVEMRAHVEHAPAPIPTAHTPAPQASPVAPPAPYQEEPEEESCPF